MAVRIGIDIGSSTTKIVAFEGEHMLPPMAVKADSQVASLYGAFGRYLYENNLQLLDVEGVYITGVGSKYVEKAVYDRPTYKVDEFVATGTGGYYLTDKKEVIVISMGTGSFFVKVTENEMKHLGGVGLGGGTICGLSSIILNTGDIHEIVPLSRKGDVAKIDLRIGDLAKEKLPGPEPGRDCVQLRQSGCPVQARRHRGWYRPYGHREHLPGRNPGLPEHRHQGLYPHRRSDQILRVPPDHRRLQEPVGCEGHYSGVLRLCYRYWGGDCAGCGERGDLRNKKVRGIDFSIPLGV